VWAYRSDSRSGGHRGGVAFPKCGSFDYGESLFAGHALAYAYYENEPGRSRRTRTWTPVCRESYDAEPCFDSQLPAIQTLPVDYRIAINIAKLPELLKRPQY
jgi:hypothetical protein